MTVRRRDSAVVSCAVALKTVLESAAESPGRARILTGETERWSLAGAVAEDIAVEAATARKTCSEGVSIAWLSCGEGRSATSLCVPFAAGGVKTGGGERIREMGGLSCSG